MTYARIENNAFSHAHIGASVAIGRRDFKLQFGESSQNSFLAVENFYLF